jgi:renalase
MQADVIIVGAGVAGLRCATLLRREGAKVVVVDRARGVGGRCATRRFSGQPVDFGVAFLHGHKAEFLAAIDEVDGATRIAGWPLAVEGTGKPCQPDAFSPNERRTAFVEGLAAFPKHLARGLDLRLRTNVTAVAASRDGFEVRSAEGTTLSARDLVLATALEQNLALLAGLGGTAAVDSLRALLSMVASLPCITLIAGYPLTAATPAWDICYPADSEQLQVISHDSSKRRDKQAAVFVYQALPRWSRQNLTADGDVVQRALLEEAGHRLGAWASRPEWTSLHTWRYARVDRGNELVSPPSVSLSNGGRLGLAGDLFAPGGGIQAAFLSGGALARRFLCEEHQ